MIALAAGMLALGCSDQGPLAVEDGYVPTLEESRIAEASLSPATVSLSPGDTIRFEVSFTDDSGKPVRGPVRWSATGGTIDKWGLYEAGERTGEFHVIGEAHVTGAADTAVVTITSSGETPVTTVSVLPGEASLAPGESVEFQAQLLDDGTESSEDSVTWEATGGSIDTKGRYVAGAETGNFRVIARTRDTGSADTAKVTISSSEDPGEEEGIVTTVSVSPSSASLAPGESLLFQARLLDETGNVVDGAVRWEATGGSIDDAGLYVAGSVVGDFRVVAHALDGDAQGSASVKISEPEVAVDGVPIRAGEDIQRAVNQYPAGTTFLIRSGRHVRQSVAPKDGNVFVGEDGAVLDGELATEFAFRGGARNVTVRNLEITRYRAWDDRQGALNLWDARGWRLENLNVHHNKVDGVNAWGEITIVGGSYSYNGRTGLSISQGENIVVDGVELAHNHDGSFQSLWHAGGLKFARVRNVVIRNNHVHSNDGPGIWCDIDCRDVEIARNLVEANQYAGIFYEISTRAVIRGNTIRQNGFSAGGGYHGSGVLVASSSDVRVEGNTLRGNRDGVVGLQKARGGYSVTGLRVLDNDIRGTARGNGLVDRDGDGRVFSSDNRFDRNSYRNLTDRPFWGRGGLLTVSQWLGTGQDGQSTFD